MSMHLHHPALSTAGKKKGKPKFRNADEARQARDLDESWKLMQKKWGVDADEKKRTRALAAEPLVYKLETPVGRTNTHHIKSLDTGIVPCVKLPDKIYTGDMMLGISQMAKSNAIPVFDSSHITEIARMRR